MPTIDTRTDVSIDFEVVCANCGAGLCRRTTVKGNVAYVEPCPSCIEDAKKDSYEEGMDDGIQKMEAEERNR